MPTVNFQTCTGESRSYIAFRMQHRPCPALLHSTDPAQQELEATVFRTLDRDLGIMPDKDDRRPPISTWRSETDRRHHVRTT